MPEVISQDLVRIDMCWMSAYHPRKCVVANLFMITRGARIFGLTANVTVDAWKPTLL